MIVIYIILGILVWWFIGALAVYCGDVYFTKHEDLEASKRIEYFGYGFMGVILWLFLIVAIINHKEYFKRISSWLKEKPFDFKGE